MNTSERKVLTGLAMLAALVCMLATEWVAQTARHRSRENPTQIWTAPRDRDVVAEESASPLYDKALTGARKKEPEQGR